MGTIQIYYKPMDLCLTLPCSRGDSGALYLQSATAGVMSFLGKPAERLPGISDVDILVLRNRNL